MIKLPKQDSSNSKLGKKVRATYREVGPTCPQSCPHLQKSVCYALYGFVNIHAKKSPYHGTDAQRVHDWLLNLPRGHKVRHHVSGDFMEPSGQVDEEYVDSLLAAHEARSDLQGWSYTHAWDQLKSSRLNSTKSLTVNASCDSLEEVEEALEAGWPSTMVVDQNAESKPLKIDGQKARLVICPHQTHGIQCSECMLCFRKARSCVVGFRVHGTGKSKFSS